MKRVLLLFLAPALALVSCGDPLIGINFFGTPELSVGGVVRQANARVPGNHGALELSVFWIRAGDTRPIEQDAELDSGLAEYSMTLFDPPPPDAAGFSELLGGDTLAIGVIALYADKNENDALELSTDLLLGASEQHLLVYAGEAIAAETPAGSLLGSIDAGYHVYQHDRASSCRFVVAGSCAPEGGLVPATDLSAIALTLWEEPSEVIVPAPALLEGSVWTTP